VSLSNIEKHGYEYHFTGMAGPEKIWLGKMQIAVNFNQSPITQKYG